MKSLPTTNPTRHHLPIARRRPATRFTASAAVAATIATIAVTALSVAPASAADYSPDLIAYAQQNCGSIKSSLSQLQIADSSTRSYLGGIYAATADNFIAPLGVRLVRNSLDPGALLDIQTRFGLARATFASDYITYSKSLDALQKINCGANPTQFLDQLAETRAARRSVANDVRLLHELITTQRDQVTQLKDSL